MLWSSKLFEVYCAFHWEECGGCFSSGNLHPSWLCCHSATNDVKNSLYVGVWSIRDEQCVFLVWCSMLVQRRKGEREFLVSHEIVIV